MIGFWWVVSLGCGSVQDVSALLWTDLEGVWPGLTGVLGGGVVLLVSIGWLLRLICLCVWVLGVAACYPVWELRVLVLLEG